MHSQSLSKSYSHQEVNCGYCDRKIRRDKLQSHTTTFHPNLPPMTRGEKNIRGDTAQDLLKAQRQEEREERDRKRAERELEDQRVREANLKSFADQVAAEKLKVQKAKEAAEKAKLEENAAKEAREAEAAAAARAEQEAKEIAEVEALRKQVGEGLRVQPEIASGSGMEGAAPTLDLGEDHEMEMDQENISADDILPSSLDHRPTPGATTRDMSMDLEEDGPCNANSNGAPFDFDAEGNSGKRRRVWDTTQNQGDADCAGASFSEDVIHPPPSLSPATAVPSALQHTDSLLTAAHFDESIDELKKMFSQMLQQRSSISSAASAGGQGSSSQPLSATADTNSSSSTSTSMNHNLGEGVKPLTNADKRGLMNSAKSIEDIIRHNPQFAPWHKEDGSPAGLRCKPCTEAPSAGGNKQLGHLNFDPVPPTNSAGRTAGATDIEALKEKAFRNLKKKASTHIDSISHQKNSQEFAEIEAKEAEQACRNEVVGERIARCALKACIEDKSQTQFENEISHLAACGVDVGEINHSRKFAAEMSQHFAASLKEQLQRNLNAPQPASDRPAPFSVIADAMTPNRDTLQITGVVTNLHGQQKDLFLEAAKLKEHSGAEMAKTMHEAVSKQLGLTDEDLRGRLVGVAGDGQYIKNHAAEKLGERIGMTTANDWMSRHWDPAHLIELADKDARASHLDKTERKQQKSAPNKNKWVDETKDTIQDLNKKHKMGKGWHELQEAAGGNARATNTFSGTRFAAHSHNVLENFQHNYPALYDKLNAQSSGDLRKIDNAPVVLRSSGLCDVYKEVSKCSREVQNPGNYPWIVNQAVHDGVQNLKQMSNELKEPDRMEFPNMKHYSAAVTELSNKHTFKEKPVLNRAMDAVGKSTRNKTGDGTRQHQSASSAIESSKKELENYIDTVSRNIETRFNEQLANNRATSLANEAFSTNSILKAKDDPELSKKQEKSFSEYAELAKKAGYIEKNKSIESLRPQYKSYTERIQEKAKSYLSPSTTTSQSNAAGTQGTASGSSSGQRLTPNQEREFLSSFVKDPKNFHDCKDTGHLLLSGMTRTHCEAVVEGMGNVVDQRIHSRGSLGLEKLSAETFVTWNTGNSAAAPREFLVDSLERRFGEDRKDWHFTTKTQQSRLKLHTTSQVVDRIRKDEGRVSWDTKK